ncbi:MAG: methylmalonyl-CoA mutase family protein [Bacteroidota bacterium]
MHQGNDDFLFDSFPPVTDQEWKDKILKDLKGKSWDKLKWSPEKNLEFEPYYRASDLNRSEMGVDSLPGEFPYRRGTHFATENDGWQIIQSIHPQHENWKERMQSAQNQEVFAFQFEADQEVEELEPFFEQIDFDQTALHVRFPNVPALLSLDLYTVLNQKGHSPKVLTGTLLNDPISAAAANGEVPELADFAQIEGGVLNFKQSPWFRGIGLDFTYIQKDGGGVIPQIAYALGTLVEYLDWHERTQSQISLKDLLKNVAVTLPVSTNFFLEIAKFRAFRLLYAKVLQAYGLEDEQTSAPFLIAETSTFDFSFYDAYNNLLRSTTAAMSAVFGGVQGIVIKPFDHSQEELAARLGRNIQHLLRHESYLDKVIDPAGGAYYIEELTNQVAHQAWDAFQQIEKRGGFVEMLKSGEIQQQMEEFVATYEHRTSTQKDILVGINKYPNTEEIINETLPHYDGRGGQFEALRTRVHQMPKRPKAFLLLFGNTAMRNARAQFSRNALGSAGIDIIENSYLDDPMASLQEAKESGAEILVFCSSNADYAAQIDSLLEKSKELAYQPMFIQAGQTEGWREQGINAVLYAGMDLAGFLNELVGLLEKQV